MKPWAGAATAAAAAGDGGRHDVGAAGGVQADGGEQGVEQQEQEQGVQQEQKEEEEQEQDEELGAVVQQVEELEEAVRSLCEVRAKGCGGEGTVLINGTPVPLPSTWCRTRMPQGHNRRSGVRSRA